MKATLRAAGSAAMVLVLVGSIPAPVVAQPDPNQQQTTPQVKANSDNDDNNNAQTTRAPLPPGQGTRVDQLA